MDAFDDEGVLLMAEEEDSKILRSHIGDNPSHTLLLVTELPSWFDDVLPNAEQCFRLVEGDEGDGKDEEGVDWLLHSSTSPGLIEELLIFEA